MGLLDTQRYISAPPKRGKQNSQHSQFNPDAEIHWVELREGAGKSRPFGNPDLGGLMSKPPRWKRIFPGGVPVWMLWQDDGMAPPPAPGVSKQVRTSWRTLSDKMRHRWSGSSLGLKEHFLTRPVDEIAAKMRRRRCAPHSRRDPRAFLCTL